MIRHLKTLVSSEPVRKQVVKLRLKMEDSVELSDTVLKASILNNASQKFHIVIFGDIAYNTDI